MDACQAQMIGCGKAAAKYQNSDSNVTITNLQNAGPQQFCDDVKNVSDCFVSALNQTVCSHIPPYVGSMITKGVSFIKLLCVDKFSDLKKHWSCMLTAQSNQNLSKCETEAQGLRNCTITPLVNCIANQYNNAPGCQAGAADFIRQVLPAMISVGVQCPAQPTIAASLLEYYMRMK